jgi:hypothetical protein
MWPHPLPLARPFGPAIIAPAASGRSPLHQISPLHNQRSQTSGMVINSRQIMSALEAAFFESSRRGRRGGTCFDSRREQARHTFLGGGLSHEMPRRGCVVDPGAAGHPRPWRQRVAAERTTGIGSGAARHVGGATRRRHRAARGGAPRRARRGSSRRRSPPCRRSRASWAIGPPASVLAQRAARQAARCRYRGPRGGTRRARRA